MKGQAALGLSLRRVAILLVLLVAFAFRCFGLDAQELRGDEAFGYFFSLPDFDEIVEQTLDMSEPHPVASYWLQHAWLQLAGQSEYALRFTGVWWSVLAVSLIIPLAAELALPALVGVVAAALMALSPYAIWHAQDARMYNMSLALTLASTWLAVCWWQSSQRVRAWWAGLGYVLVAWLALQTHYFSLYVVVAQQVALSGWAVADGAWRKLVLWWGMGLGVLLLWVPWLVAAWSILLDYRGNGDSPGLIDALVRSQSAFGVGETVPGGMMVWWATLGLSAVIWGIFSLWKMPAKRGHGALWLLLVYWLMPLLTTWVSAQSRPIFNERYLVAIVPPVYLLMATAVVWRGVVPWRLWLGRMVLALVMVGMLLGVMRQTSDPQYSKTRGWRELAAAFVPLTAGVEPNLVRLAQNYPDPTLWYYYQGAVAHLVLPPASRDADGSVEEVARFVGDGVKRVILVEQPSASWDTGTIAREALTAEYALGGMVTVERWPLSIWLRPPVELATLDVEYEGGLRLTGAAIVPEVVPSGGIVEVHLRWQGDAGSVGANEAVSTQVLDGAGALVAQSDRTLGMASVTTADVESYAILMPNVINAMPGGSEFQVVVVVYDPSRDGAPRRMTMQGADRVVLGTIRVKP